MKSLIIETPPQLASIMLDYGDNSLPAIRGLMDLGCFGPLKFDHTPNDSSAVTAKTQSGSWSDRLRAASQLWSSQTWDRWHHQDLDASADPTEIDSAIGSILETLDDETLLLIASRPTSAEAPGAFVLVVPKLPPKGLLEDVRCSNLGPTLMEFSGVPLNQDQQALSLVGKITQGMTASDFDEEAIVRDRLLGLGYLG